MFFSFAIIVISCNCGEFLVLRFDMVAEELYKSDWYLFPLEVQRMLIVVIAQTQQPTYIRSYGNITFTRQTLKMVTLQQFNDFNE